MISVVRLIKPAILVRKESVWLKALQSASSKTAKEHATNRYRHPEIQKALAIMFQGKCAYCESRIDHVSDAHIEHYRPKSRFPHLTFDWDNLLLACGKCNSSRYKGDKFPEANEDGPLINPCVDTPSDHFTFQFDAKVQLASVYGQTPRGKKTEALLGLNRTELRRHRSTRIKHLAVLARLAQTDKEAKALLEEACRDDAEYAAFARTL